MRRAHAGLRACFLLDGGYLCGAGSVPPFVLTLVTKAMVMVEMSPGATVTVEVWAAGLQGPCRPGGKVAQSDIVKPRLGNSLMKTVPATTSMAGEQAPAGTTNGPRPPGLTENVKSPDASFPLLQISKEAGPLVGKRHLGDTGAEYDVDAAYAEVGAHHLTGRRHRHRDARHGVSGRDYFGHSDVRSHGGDRADHDAGATGRGSGWDRKRAGAGGEIE